MSASKLSDLKTLRFSSNLAATSLRFAFAAAAECSDLDRDVLIEAIELCYNSDPMWWVNERFPLNMKTD